MAKVVATSHAYLVLRAQGLTVLEVAVMQQCVEVAKVLLCFGAAANAYSDQVGYACLITAASSSEPAEATTICLHSCALELWQQPTPTR